MGIDPPDYDKVERELWIKHGNEVLGQLRNQDSGLLRRIHTFCERFGFDETEVCEKIIDDNMFACCFAKDAKKQDLKRKKRKNIFGCFLM